MSEELYIDLKNVIKKYTQFELNCSMQLKKGYITGLIGQNGAGKSTTFKAILGLIAPDAGEVTVLGKKPQSFTKEDKENIGVVLADSGFSGWLTVTDTVAVMKGMYKRFDERKFLDSCKHYEIPLNKKIKDFSTGMRAKLKVLLAISHDARLLILDEPTAGLDVVARDELLDVLREYMQTEECSILISSHISSDLEGLCDDIYMIEHGGIILHEDTDVLLNEYGVLKLTEEQYQLLDKSYIIRQKKENWGWQCLTDRKQFYLENAPQITVEKSGIDEIILMLTKGEER